MTINREGDAVTPGVTGEVAAAIAAYRCPFCGGETAVTWQAGLPIFHCPACDEVAGP